MRPAGAADFRMARRASGFLLELYALSHSLSMERFQAVALEHLRSELPFRSAWWGTVRVRAGGNFTLHNHFSDALPDDFAACWEIVKHDDALAVKVTTAPGTAVNFGAADLRRMANLSVLVERFGIGSALAIATVEVERDLFTFLSLYRPPDAAPFREDERCLQELLMPHLVAARHANRLHHFEHLRADERGARGGMAMSDQFGLLYMADPSFVALLRREWPQWKGTLLPLPLREAVSRCSRYCGRQLSIDIWREHDLIGLRAAAHTLFDRLSPREAEIAASYRDGLSYKEIAARLACSPYTVRHHLRIIYDKLGVSNKAALARLAGETNAPKRS